jgi:hypothetical protein
MANWRTLLSPRPSQADWWVSWADPLRIDLRSPRGRRSYRHVVFAFAVLATGLIVDLIPARVDGKAFGELSYSGLQVIPGLCFMVGDLCLATALWAAVATTRGRALERAVIACLGLAVAALVGPCVRLTLQVVLLRDFYRPLLFFSSPSRAAAIVWGSLMALILVCGFLAPLAVTAANLLTLLPQGILLKVLPHGIKMRYVSWLASRHRWLLLPFMALAATVAITQWILSPPLASAMGYTYPLLSGAESIISLRVIGVRAWYSFQILDPLPLLTGMWAGVEAARTCQRLVKSPSGSDTKLLIIVRRFDYRLAAGLFGASAVAVAILQRNLPAILAMLAVVGIVVIVVLSLAGARALPQRLRQVGAANSRRLAQLAGMARLTTRFEQSVSRWQLPKEWLQLGPASLVISVLALPLLSLLAGEVYRGAEAAVRFPFDASKFFFYWQDYGIFGIPHATVAEVFGNVYFALWVGCAAFALVSLWMVVGFGGHFKSQLLWASWLLFRISLLAFLLASAVRLADHSYGMFLLAACVIPALFLADLEYRPTLVWSVLIVGGALSLWSLILFRLEWIPAAAVIGFTALQRFAFNAGKDLNTQDDEQTKRIAYLQAIALLSTGMLALGHGAINGYFQSDALSVVADRVALSVIAMLWLVILISPQGLRREKKAAATSTPNSPAPAPSPPTVIDEVAHGPADAG